jgi:Spy/CpxP family protein refolding chaperone
LQLYKALNRRNAGYTQAAHTANQPVDDFRLRPFKELTMKPVFTSLFVAGVLATAGFSAFAQPMGAMDGHPMMGAGGPMGHGGGPGMHGQRDPAKMEAFMAKRAAELKAKLKITATQESAWATFTTAMKPPAHMADNRPDRAEMDKLTTPERIDKMKVIRAQHMAERNAAMEKREEAVKTFYASLSPEQQKIFDAEHARLAAGIGHARNGGPGRGPGADTNSPAK